MMFALPVILVSAFGFVFAFFFDRWDRKRTASRRR